MRDEKGTDENILGVPVADPRFHRIEDLEALQKHWLLEIEDVFATYKILEGKESVVASIRFRHGLWDDPCRAALAVVLAAPADPAPHTAA